MRQFLIPTKDTTLYQAYPTNNAGLDEILEVGKVPDSTLIIPVYESSSARSLLFFELPTTASVPTTASYFLNLKIANANDIHRNQTLLISPVSRSWDEGSGYFYQDIRNVNDGATWQQATTSVSWSVAGGDRLSTPTASIQLSTYPIQDVRVDITNIIRPYVSQSTQSSFNGLEIRFPLADEENADNEGNIKFFSAQTHTIHQPTLEIVWNDQVFTTGSSLSGIPASMDVKVTPTNIKESYVHGEVMRINFTVRDQYPTKAFDATLRYANKYYLPSASYYSIIDTRTQQAVVPFDEYSKLNCDALGTYMILDTAPLYKGRFYTLKIKFVSGSYNRVIETNSLFKIV